MLKFILDSREGGVCTLTSDLDSYGGMHCLVDMKPVQNILVPVIPKIRENPDQ